MVNHEKSLTSLRVRPNENDPTLYLHTATQLSRASPLARKKTVQSRIHIYTCISPLSDEKEVFLFELQTLQRLDRSRPCPWVRIAEHLRVSPTPPPRHRIHRHRPQTPTSQSTTSPAACFPPSAITPLTHRSSSLNCGTIPTYCLHGVTLLVYTAYLLSPNHYLYYLCRRRANDQSTGPSTEETEELFNRRWATHTETLKLERNTSSRGHECGRGMQKQLQWFLTRSMNRCQTLINYTAVYRSIRR